MNWEALDDPALVVPRVLDVHGTLTRLGFVPRFKPHGVFCFYRQFVPLFRPIDPPPSVSSSRRHISHVDLIVTLDTSGDDTSRIQACYGYPERYKKKLKLIESFVKLLDNVTSTNINFNRQDNRLREFEKMVGELVACLKTKVLDTAVELDSDTGLVKVAIPDYDALTQAVGHYLCVRLAHHKEDEWWSDASEAPVDPHYSMIGAKSGRVSSRSPNLSRLPSHDRRRLIRNSVRRPV